MRSLFATAMLVFCSASFAQNSINITSWNIEWLAINGGKVSRTENDFAKLNQYVSNSQADVLAFQEVDSEAAIKKVVGNGYDIYFSDRAQPGNKHLQFSNTNQYTGFAVRKGIPVSDPSDFSITRGNSKLRFASYIVLNPDERNETHLLSVHLKAGCSGAYKNSRECKTLKQQGEALAHWIKAREKNQEQYAILGDFNHNLDYQGDWLWSTMTSNTSARLATKNTKAECKVRSNRNPNKTHQFRSVIDHIIVSGDLTAHPAKQVIFKSQDVLDYQLSDHCPVSAQVRLSKN
ncbi:endonuclease/exonuclease/phosphatase family protein [Vibrio sp. EA2]|uniref:endonuclease/exonuclease/phosphatase family protein n=1 Tax=Vibrio sp. EA2 TaxID=3079860 RepID=UPI002949F9BF|nr:endonuclease/exonuclease/phosphatase family protein [Vibrio sp. EA2]MDV6250128.1 endonuclease/exonuclease/phosphatase family protein [Vibrio sp. EA2]